MLEDVWLDAVKVHSPRRFLFLAETVFVYFTEAQVRSLVRALRDRLPGAELVFDAFRSDSQPSLASNVSFDCSTATWKARS